MIIKRTNVFLNDDNEILRMIACMCALYKAYTSERAWKAIGDRLQATSYLSRVNHYWKIRCRKQRTDIGIYSFVNRNVTEWNKLPEGAIGTSQGKTHIFKTRDRKVKTSEGKCCSMYFCVVLYIVCFVTYCVLFVCVCVLNYCQWVATQLQLNILYYMYKE
jgi:hypothetical protein